MAPPPPANLPLQERLLKLAQTLQFGWFVGHLVLLLAVFRYSLSFIRFNYNGTAARYSYRIAFVAAAVTYGIVVYKTLKAKQKMAAKQPIAAGGALSFAADENVQYLALALVWLFCPQYPLALLPYAIYSVFHVATYTRANVIPTVQPAKPAAAGTNGKPAANPIADAIGGFVKQYYDTSMSVVSALEILLWGRLLLAAIFFSSRSWILLTVYTAFLRARFSQSSHVQNSFSQLEAQVDNLVGAQNTPPQARQAWEGVKGVARQFYSATDISKYIGGNAVPKKDS